MPTGRLYDRILRLIEHDQWLLSVHANEMIQQRRLEIWQIISLTLEGELLREDLAAKPRPKVEIKIQLPDGTAAKAVWGYDRTLDRAVLITVHFYDR